MHKLRVWQITRTTYDLVFRNQIVFWRIAALPMAIYYAAFVAAHVAGNEEIVESIWPGVGGLLLFILTVPFVVAWHRFVLLGSSSAAGHRGLRYGRREGKFFLIFLGISVVLGVMIGVITGLIGVMTFFSGANAPSAANAGGAGSPGFPFILLSQIIIVIVLAPITRLALVLPSIAIDEGASPCKSWRLTRGNTYRFTAVIGFTGIAATCVFQYLLIPSVSLAPTSLGTFLSGAITMYQSFFVAAVTASAISLSYKIFTSASDIDTDSPTQGVHIDYFDAFSNGFFKGTPKRALLAIIGKSLAWGFAAGGIMFVMPIILNPEAYQGSFPGILPSQVRLILIGTFLAGTCQIRRALTLPKGGKVGYGLFLLLFLLLFLFMFLLSLRLTNSFIFVGLFAAALALFLTLMAIIFQMIKWAWFSRPRD